MAPGKRKGKSSRRAAQKQGDEPEELKKAPHSFVLYRGQVGKRVAELVRDFRKLMEPYTAAKLKVLKSNQLKDFVAISGVLNVTHMVLFTKTSIGVYVKIIRLPQGPTLTFRITNYSLARDVISSLKKPVTYANQFQHHPLLVLNNFSGEGAHMKLMGLTFQNMFPSINVHKVKLNNIRRCVLLNYNANDSSIDFRHYTIKVAPTGLSKGVKKLISNKVPNLGNFTDISDFIINSGNLSESEAELDGPNNKVVLPQNVSSRGNIISEQSAIRLVELGPRLTLQLIKIEEGVVSGEVMFHHKIKRTPEEIEILRKRMAKKKKLKEQRRKQQELNIRAREEQKEVHKEKSLKGMSEKRKIEETDTVEADVEDDDDDEAWFQRETGQKMDKEISVKRKRKFQRKM